MEHKSATSGLTSSTIRLPLYWLSHARTTTNNNTRISCHWQSTWRAASRWTCCKQIRWMLTVTNLRPN